MRQLTKSRDRKVFGVAGGLAEYFEMDKSIMRAIVLLGCIFIPPLFLAYLVLGIVLPHPDPGQTPPPPEPEVVEMHARKGEPGRTEFTAGSPKRRLTKSHDRWIGGVAAGIADYFGADPILIRALFMIAFFGFGTGLLVYIVLAIVMPRPQLTAQ